MAHAFISYVRDNAVDVDRLCADLIKAGVKVWLDRNDIHPGARWRDAIRDAIRSGDYFIACFSAEYAARGKAYMNEELTLAIEELRQLPASRIWFIPVLLSECEVPARSIGAGETLLDINWIPLYADWMEGIRRILSIVNPTPMEVQRLIEALRSDDTEIRRSAARALGDKAHPSAAKALTAALNDSDESVHQEAIGALSRYGALGVEALADAVLTADSETANRLTRTILSRVAVEQDDAAFTILAKVYRSGGDRHRATIDNSIGRLKSWYQYDYDSKMGEVMMFEGLLGQYPVREERALKALDALLGKLGSG